MKDACALSRGLWIPGVWPITEGGSRRWLLLAEARVGTPWRLAADAVFPTPSMLRGAQHIAVWILEPGDENTRGRRPYLRLVLRQTLNANKFTRLPMGIGRFVGLFPIATISGSPQPSRAFPLSRQPHLRRSRCVCSVISLPIRLAPEPSAPSGAPSVANAFSSGVFLDHRLSGSVQWQCIRNGSADVQLFPRLCGRTVADTRLSIMPSSA